MALDFVRIQLDKPRKIKFDLNAVAEFEEETGSSFVSIASDGADGLGMKHVRALLWAGLLHEDQKITVKEAGDLVQHAKGDRFIDKMKLVTDAVVKAFLASYGDIPEDTMSQAREDADSSDPSIGSS